MTVTPAGAMFTRKRWPPLVEFRLMLIVFAPSILKVKRMMESRFGFASVSTAACLSSFFSFPTSVPSRDCAAPGHNEPRVDYVTMSGVSTRGSGSIIFEIWC